MRKKLAILATVVSLAVNAGEMGPISTLHTLQPFISAEGGYTWSQIGGTQITVVGFESIRTYKRVNGGTGRIAAGFLKPVRDSFAVSSEIGWGYYGNTRLRPQVDISALALEEGFPNLGGFNSKLTQNGFDVLVGAIYTRARFDLFLKAGALIQNSQAKLTANLPSFIGDSVITINRTQALPEIKLGGSYHVSDSIAFTGAWTHAFGYNPKNTILLDPNNPMLQVNFNFQNPTLDSVMVGVQYFI